MALTSDDFAELKDGTLVPVAARDLLVDLDLRGLAFTVQDGKLRVSNKDGTRPELTETETAAIRKYKAPLLHLVGLDL